MAKRSSRSTRQPRTTSRVRRRGRRPVNVNQYVLNCVPSAKPEEDWTFGDAVSAGVVDAESDIPVEMDLRAPWWTIRDQQTTGACVGFATADGVLRWHYVTSRWIRETDRPSPRFIWMANKETDEITSYPTTFLEPEGTQTKLALAVARRYGCVLEQDLPMSGPLSTLGRAAFYTLAATLRIASFHNLGTNLANWKHWLATQGPILTRLSVDKSWDNATTNGGRLEKYVTNPPPRGGHAVCLVGYTDSHFIVRNSWGTGWGDDGFAYASTAYARKAFTEAYGAIL